MNGLIALLYLASALVFGGVTAALWHVKGGRAGVGFWAGALLGLVGLLWLVVRQPRSWDLRGYELQPPGHP